MNLQHAKSWKLFLVHRKSDLKFPSEQTASVVYKVPMFISTNQRNEERTQSPALWVFLWESARGCVYQSHSYSVA